MNSIMAASQARARTVEEYEKKMRDMERDFQERLREEVSRRSTLEHMAED